MKNTTPFVFTALLTAAAGLTACSDSNNSNNSTESTPVKTDAPEAAVSMTQLPVVVSYRERIMLPPSAQISVTLEDVSRMDVAATIIDKQTISAQSGPPYQLTMTYDANKINPKMRYALRARIEQNGKLIFTNTSFIPAFEKTGQPVSILVQSVGGQQTPVKPQLQTLGNSNWQVIRLGADDNPKGANGQALSLSLQDGQASGFSGCNNYHGGYTIAQQSLKFSPLASTRKACSSPSATAAEQQFLHSVGKVDSYSLKNGKLLLTSENMPLMELKVQ